MGCSLLCNRSNAQVTITYPVPPATKLEAFDTNIATVIVKATTEIGSVSVNSGVVSVRCREITDTSSGHKEQGIALEITQRPQGRDRLLIDYDELDSLLNALHYLNNLNISITPLNAFDAEYTTKGGLRVAALGTRPNGGVQFTVRDARTNSLPVVFSRDDMSRFGSLISQAKAKLDTLREN
jgi:hypothetical protein